LGAQRRIQFKGDLISYKKQLLVAGNVMPIGTIDKQEKGSYHLIDNLFLIPHGTEYLLYAPLNEFLSVINRAAVRSLQNIGENNIDPEIVDSEFFKKLRAVGIIQTDKMHTSENHFCNTRESAYDVNGITLILTSECSMKCIYCYSNCGDKAATMPWQTAKASIDWIVVQVKRMKMKGFNLHLHGGGGMTGVDGLLKQSVEYGREKARLSGLDIRVEAGLNGVMDDDMTEWVAHNLDGATVSFDGIASVQNIQRPLSRGEDSFDAVTTCLQRLDKERFSYGIRSTVTCGSLDMLPDSIEFLYGNFNAKTIQVEPVIEAGRAKTNQVSKIDPEFFVRQYRSAFDRARKYGKELKYSGARFGTLTNVFCKAAGNSFVVTPEGILTACYEVTESDDPRSELFFFGNYDQESGDFKIDCNKLDRLCSLTVENKPYCNKCFCKWHCAGDCAARLALLGDAWDPSQSDRCYINQELTKDQMVEHLRKIEVIGKDC
jgi:uncharacterized protein